MNTPSTHTPQELRFIRLSEVCRKTGLGKSSIYALKAEGKFPATVSLGARAVAFVEAEVDQWLADRLAERAAA